ncbi:RNA polymerase sigma factor RpoD, partial [Lactobacillus sp. XV13L]|nr:RNA polymerase sigma factor RpoD [Lactobacillus sp. XV13L]
MTEKKKTNGEVLSLDKLVKEVVKDVKKDKAITEKEFVARMVEPYELKGKAVDQLVQEFEDNGISIVDDKGEPSKLALKKQKDVEKAELKDMSAPSS